MSQSPTDPMTPVRALIEAAGKATPGPWYLHEMTLRCKDNDYRLANITMPAPGLRGKEWAEDYEVCLANANFLLLTRNATASISQLLSEHDKVVEYIKELQEQAAHEMGDYIDVSAEKRAKDECADRLQSIQEGK